MLDSVIYETRPHYGFSNTNTSVAAWTAEKTIRWF